MFGFSLRIDGAERKDSTGLEAAFYKLDEAKACLTSSPNKLFCFQQFEEAYKISKHHAYFLEEIVAFLLANEEYAEARRYVFVKRVDTLANSLQSRHHHFKGIIELKLGFDYFTEAYKSFRRAYYLELRAAYPTFKFLSQIQNAMGYTRMLYGGTDRNGEEDYPHVNWMTSDLVSALKHFEQALYFDAENEHAQANKDTLFAKILQSGFEIDKIEQLIKPKPISTIQKELLVSDKSLNDTLDEINISYLPNNAAVILNTLEAYEELLVVADISGSMEDIHPIKEVDRFTLMRELILFLYHNLAPTTQCGIVTVGRGCGRLPILFYPVQLNARKDIVDTLKTLYPGGSTPLSYSMAKSKQLYTDQKNKKALFLISDGVETCDSPMDLCLVASDLHAMGVDIHIISFIVAGMEDYELAYELYNCMTQYSGGRVFEFDELVVAEEPHEPEPFHEEILLLPPIRVGDNFGSIKHFEVDLSEYIFPLDKQ